MDVYVYTLKIKYIFMYLIPKWLSDLMKKWAVCYRDS